MNIVVKVIKVLEQASYQKRSGERTTKFQFVGQTQEQQYPKTIKFDVWGDESWNNMHISVGGTFDVSFDIESSEWNGKWFTNLRCWKVQPVDGQANVQQHSTDAPQSQNVASKPQNAPSGSDGGQGDDLPF